MTRLMLMTFFGEALARGVHPHESPLVMTVPLICSAGSGSAGWC